MRQFTENAPVLFMDGTEVEWPGKGDGVFDPKKEPGKLGHMSLEAALNEFRLVDGGSAGGKPPRPQPGHFGSLALETYDEPLAA